MEIKLKNNIVFSSFENKKEMKEKIIDFIFNSKTDKILYKGNPTEINYKLLKKILPTTKDITELSDYIEIKDKSIRDTFNEFIDKIGSYHCLIYKK
jgi:hypothetical protein